MMFLLAVATLCWWVFVDGQLHFPLSEKLIARHSSGSFHLGSARPLHKIGSRSKRISQHIISECIFMSSSEGNFYYKAREEDLGTACGIYIFSELDQSIEIRFNYLDVPCENGGLVSFIDGWELNGEFFPSLSDHPRSMEDRFSEFCGNRKPKQIFSSSQNVALLQYRMASRSASFSFSVNFVKNSSPCNGLLQDTEDIITLKNYGKRSNCSISALFPAAVQVISLNVGVVPNVGRGMEMETGTFHKCQKRGLDDYLQIGGTSGLDNSKLLLADTLCGIDSKKGKASELIACGVTTVRLLSSGAYNNVATFAIRKLTEEDITGYMSIVCPIESVLK